MAYEVNRIFAKRETEKSNWSGRIGSVTLTVTDDGNWAIVSGDYKDGATTVLSRASIEYLLTFSLQSLQDAYAGAANLTEAQANYVKKLTALCEGTIGVRGEGGGMSDEERAELYVAEAWYLTKNAKGTEKGDAFRAMKGDDKTEFLVNVASALREKWEPFAAKVAERVEHVVAQRKRRAEEKAALAAVDVEIDL